MINWTQIDTVLLDMDGTLLDLHFDNYFWMEHIPKVYSTTFDIPHADAVVQLHQQFDEMRGSMEWYCLDYWSERLNLNIIQLKHDLHEKIVIRPHTENFLKALQGLNKQVLLVTNAHRGSLELKMLKTELDRYFDGIISTHDYGMPKEEQGLWKALQNDHHFTPATTLLIDDTEAVLASAELYGIKHLITLKQPDSQAEIREDLKYPAILHFDEIMPNE